jgi:hypothetical protein
MAAENYDIARRHFSYSNLKHSLLQLMGEFQPSEMDDHRMGPVSITPDAKIFYLHGSTRQGHRHAMGPLHASR